MLAESLNKMKRNENSDISSNFNNKIPSICAIEQRF